MSVMGHGHHLLHEHDEQQAEAAPAARVCVPGACQGLSRPGGGGGAGLRALLFALAITSGMMVVELVAAILTGSLALLADAGHMLTDAGGLGLALFAAWVAGRKATPEKTYGYYRAEIIAALLNGSVLITLAVLMLVEAWERLAAPPEVRSGPMLAVAVAGLSVNLIAGAVLYRSTSSAAHASLNARAALLHVVGDALGSVAAIGAAVAMLLFEMWIADVVASGIVSAIILIGAVTLVSRSVDILLEGSPRHVDVRRLERELLGVSGVRSVHDLHVWTITSGVYAMSCHASIDRKGDCQRVLGDVTGILRERFGIDHTTIQMEHSPEEATARP